MTRIFVVLLFVGCQRTHAASTTTTTTAASSVAAAVSLTPIPSTSSTVIEVAIPTVDALRLAPKASTPSVTKRDPLRACCDALRKQPQVQAAQAAAVCDGVVVALDDTGQVPELEKLLKPVLADAPLPPACKGL